MKNLAHKIQDFVEHPLGELVHFIDELQNENEGRRVALSHRHVAAGEKATTAETWLRNADSFGYS